MSAKASAQTRAKGRATQMTVVCSPSMCGTLTWLTRKKAAPRRAEILRLWFQGVRSAERAPAVRGVAARMVKARSAVGGASVPPPPPPPLRIATVRNLAADIAARRSATEWRSRMLRATKQKSWSPMPSKGASLSSSLRSQQQRLSQPPACQIPEAATPPMALSPRHRSPCPTGRQGLGQRWRWRRRQGQRQGRRRELTRRRK
mmetsp:Transcript_32076/g.80679  ORF Transcript_32076/g.80679 Transcript_32076/m.80679 type:complete len:203 (+) Transcript_32076:499-1107(+)